MAGNPSMLDLSPFFFNYSPQSTSLNDRGTSDQDESPHRTLIPSFKSSSDRELDPRASKKLNFRVVCHYLQSYANKR